MKSIAILLSISIAAFSVTACKSKKHLASTTSNVVTDVPVNHATEITNTTASTTNPGAFAGKVSHKYKDGGCETVIIIQAEGDNPEIVLIPKDKLNKDIDMDGQTITFDYHPLKMPQPAGCTVGIPAEITNITKMK